MNAGSPEQSSQTLQPGTLSIGRESENAIFVLHKSLSRRHAQLEISDTAVTLVDLKSKNGTFVNGERIERRGLQPGDEFRCGDITFRLQGGAPKRADEATPSRLQDVRTGFAAFSFNVEANAGKTMLGAIATDSATRVQDKLRILLKVSQLLSSPDKIDSLLVRILDLVFQILDVDRAAILMLDATTGEFVVRQQKVRPGQAPGSIFSRNIVNYVRTHRVGALFSDATADSRLGDAKSILAQSIKTSMCAPLLPAETLLGVLYVDNLGVTDRFSAEDLEFLTAFANQAAVAVQNSMLQEQIEQAAVLRAQLSRFFPPTTLKKLEGAALERFETRVTALFCDLSSFTELSSTMPPMAVMEMLNEYLPAMAEVIFRYDGTLEKYIGDALLAVWGAPFLQTDDADRAVRAAIAMHWALEDLNERREASGKSRLHIHIGLNSGQVAAGPLGHDRYLQYAAIGDATNVASRVCSAANSGELMISEATRLLCQQPWPLQSVGLVHLKGKEQPVHLHRVDWKLTQREHQ